jgi:hypothetical protein
LNDGVFTGFVAGPVGDGILAGSVVGAVNCGAFGSMMFEEEDAGANAANGSAVATVLDAGAVIAIKRLSTRREGMRWNCRRF